MYDIIDALIGVAEDRGVAPAQVALAYILGKPAVSSVILGARNEEQLLDNIGSVELRLSETERATLDAVSALPLIYPYWHQAASASERLSEADESLLAPFHE